VTDGRDGEATYVESLPIPFLISLVAVVIALTFGIAVGAALGWLAGTVTGVVVVGGVVVLLARGTGRVSVEGGELFAGRARLPQWARGRVEPLDAEAARRLRGVDADVQAYLYLKGWVPTAVRVEVVDPDDPTPYWYVSTRRPDELAAALTPRAAAEDGEPA
jgi:hypothetical protein